MAIDSWREAAFNLVVAGVPSRRLRVLALKALGATVVPTATVSRGLRLLGAAGIHLDAGSVVGEGTWLDGRAGLRLGPHSVIGAHCMVFTVDHDLQAADFASRFGPVTIGERVFIGSKVLILPGVTIGDGAAVGGGAVVTRDVPAGAVVAGNPATVVGQRPASQLTYTLDRVPWLR